MYTKSQDYPIYSEIIDFYESINPADVPIECQKLKQFLMAGYSWYTKNKGKDGEHEYHTIISFVDGLRAMFEKTLLFHENGYTLTISNGQGMKANIVPLLQYLNSETIACVKSGFLLLQDFMVSLLHDGNIIEFKECSVFVREFTTSLFNM